MRRESGSDAVANRLAAGRVSGEKLPADSRMNDAPVWFWVNLDAQRIAVAWCPAQPAGSL